METVSACSIGQDTVSRYIPLLCHIPAKTFRENTCYKESRFCILANWTCMSPIRGAPWEADTVHRGRRPRCTERGGHGAPKKASTVHRDRQSRCSEGGDHGALRQAGPVHRGRQPRRTMEGSHCALPPMVLLFIYSISI